MYIQSRRVIIPYRALLAVLSAVGLWLEFQAHAALAWRLFPTWVLVIATVYYLFSTFFSWWQNGRQIERSSLCAMILGMLNIAGLILLLGRVLFSVNQVVIPGVSGFGIALIDFILPILFLMDWLLFTSKGRWRFYEPWYWLSLPTIYVSWILFTSQILPNTAPLLYTYEFLNFPEVGLDNMLWWLVILAVLIVIFGYIYVAIDYTMSGQLGQHVVLPRIKTIVIEEELPETSSPKPAPHAQKTNSSRSKIAKAPAKPRPSASQRPRKNLDVIPPKASKSAKSAPKSKNHPKISSRPTPKAK